MIKAIRYIILVLFIFANISLLILNWGIFTTSQIINLGFGQITASPAIVEMLLVGLFMFLLWLTIGKKSGIKGRDH